MSVLTENIASKIRNEVINVRTKPTLLAARAKAIVLIAATVKMLFVRQIAYIPIA